MSDFWQEFNTENKNQAVEFLDDFLKKQNAVNNGKLKARIGELLKKDHRFIEYVCSYRHKINTISDLNTIVDFYEALNALGVALIFNFARPKETAIPRDLTITDMRSAMNLATFDFASGLTRTSVISATDFVFNKPSQEMLSLSMRSLSQVTKLLKDTTEIIAMPKNHAQLREKLLAHQKNLADFGSGERDFVNICLASIFVLACAFTATVIFSMPIAVVPTAIAAVFILVHHEKKAAECETLRNARSAMLTLTAGLFPRLRTRMESQRPCYDSLPGNGAVGCLK